MDIVRRVSYSFKHPRTSWPSGNKCKFSHDPNVGRKVEKVNLYEDTREDKKKGESPTLRWAVDWQSDDMKDWDEEKLRSVVTQQESKQKTSTDVCSRITVRARADGLDRVQVLHSGCRGAEVWLVVSSSQVHEDNRWLASWECVSWCCLFV